jgi:hypothetical protein
MPKINLRETDECPVKHDFHFRHGIDLRCLNSQACGLKRLLAALPADLHPTAEEVDGVVDILDAMLEQYVQTEVSR